MPRPRKPTAVLELVGAFKHNPDRAAARKDEPAVTGEIGEPPEHLSDAVKACWREIVGLAHEGTLGAGERLVMEHGAQLLAQLRADDWQVHPTIMLRYETFLGKLGLTPADRSRVQAPKKAAAASPLDRFKRPAAA